MVKKNKKIKKSEASQETKQDVDKSNVTMKAEIRKTDKTVHLEPQKVIFPVYPPALC